MFRKLRNYSPIPPDNLKSPSKKPLGLLSLKRKIDHNTNKLIADLNNNSALQSVNQNTESAYRYAKIPKRDKQSKIHSIISDNMILY